jgi:hypothetical protein
MNKKEKSLLDFYGEIIVNDKYKIITNSDIPHFVFYRNHTYLVIFALVISYKISDKYF